MLSNHSGSKFAAPPTAELQLTERRLCVQHNGVDGRYLENGP